MTGPNIRIALGAAAIFLFACSPRSSETRSDTTTTTTTGGDTRTTTVAATPECEGRCDGASATCSARLGWDCRCTEHLDVNCGGAQRMLQPPTWAWSCVPRDTTSDRGDGCPFAVATEGSVCGADRGCRYPDSPCGWNGVIATCAGGRWSVVPYAEPPPP